MKKCSQSYLENIFFVTNPIASDRSEQIREEKEVLVSVECFSWPACSAESFVQSHIVEHAEPKLPHWSFDRVFVRLRAAIVWRSQAEHVPDFECQPWSQVMPLDEHGCVNLQEFPLLQSLREH